MCKSTVKQKTEGELSLKTTFLLYFILYFSGTNFGLSLLPQNKCNCGKEQIDLSEINLSDSESGDE